MRLPSQVALVTGGTSGIARAVAVRFSQEGAAVMVADASERGGEETVEQIRASGGKQDRAFGVERSATSHDGRAETR